MIDAIRDIGKYALEKEVKSIDNPLDILIDNPANRDTKNILFIIFKSENEGFEYKRIDVEEYSKTDLKKYLYKKGSPRGTDITPTAMTTNIERTFKIKILNWFKDYNEIESDKSTKFLAKIGNCIRLNKEKILKELNEKYNKETNIISLKIDDKYVGEYKVFQDILVNKAKENLYLKYGKVSKSEDQLCSVCNQRKVEVYGFVNTFNFYTIDKPGFVSGGFQQKNAWKNYPVCLSCALTLEEGRKYLKNNLNFNFYGFRYLLIPKFMRSVSKDVKTKIFEKIEKQKNPKYRDNAIARLTSAENEIFKILEKESNYMNINFMFYDAPKGYDGSVFNILLYIEDILPSRLKTLFDAKKDVDNIDIFKECIVAVFENKKKIGEKPLEFNFGVLRDFFYDYTNKRWISKKYFLNIVNKIFTSKPINYNFLMNFIMQKIRDSFVNNYSTKISTLKGFMLLNYLNKLKLINIERINMNENNLEVFEQNVSEVNNINQKVNSFFSKFVDFFDNPAKKAVFLEGVLTQFLLNIQFRERNATPFRVKLKGLKLDDKQIKKLLPEIQNKLEDYGKNYYRDLESNISKYLVSSGNDWKMTNDEISFYFVLGMNLSYLFKKEKQNNNEGENDE